MILLFFTFSFFFWKLKEHFEGTEYQTADKAQKQLVNLSLIYKKKLTILNQKIKRNQKKTIKDLDLALQLC